MSTFGGLDDSFFGQKVKDFYGDQEKRLKEKTSEEILKTIPDDIWTNFSEEIKGFLEETKGNDNSNAYRDIIIGKMKTLNRSNFKKIRAYISALRKEATGDDKKQLLELNAKIFNDIKLSSLPKDISSTSNTEISATNNTEISEKTTRPYTISIIGTPTGNLAKGGNFHKISEPKKIGKYTSQFEVQFKKENHTYIKTRNIYIKYNGGNQITVYTDKKGEKSQIKFNENEIGSDNFKRYFRDRTYNITNKSTKEYESILITNGKLAISIKDFYLKDIDLNLNLEITKIYGK